MNTSAIGGNFMKIGNIRRFQFNNSEGEDKCIIRYNSDEVGDDIVPETYLEVTGVQEGQQIGVTGYTLSNSDGVTMKFADISGIGTVDVIESDGIYLILSSALERLELESNSDAKVIIKQVL